ncbi:pre-rRNA processing and 40S ribosomal subunit assembly [Coniosporium apollinis]|uniref:Pre-rRNA processing and 40S ribosomal subunit assembly n=1 Tax=Coniosporium apollinis TaxID=61459 RepID=A0ABQ9NNM6_9PEZI|nr:pre-rRNA processing and 40S ribosomal subunit assembly [Coniosporium apollinis]
MAVTLGKRKRVGRETVSRIETAPQDAPNDSDQEDLQAIFRRHFEAKFKPLAAPAKPKKEAVDHIAEELTEGESDWDGISEDEEAPVEIIEHSTSTDAASLLDKQAQKAFMSSKPPTSTSTSTTTKPKRPTSPTEADGEALNLKNDLALQRLLKESHLLDSTTSYSPSGSNRHKATDIRLQSLGSKSSIHVQEKMPMSHRRGITAKATSKEEQRRREAKENGVILERAVKVQRTTGGRRERGVGTPGVGKFRGGMLKLSKRDVASIEGPKKSTKGRRR